MAREEAPLLRTPSFGFRVLGWAALFLCAAPWLGSPRARAAGFEDTVGGTLALGRAAAALRVSDFMAVYQNPANLALIPAFDLGGELRLPLFASCFDRAKDNSVEYRREDPDAGFYGAESFEKVCNDAGLMPSGNLGVGRGLASGWGYGLGFFTPAAIPRLSYGDDRVVTQLPLPTETARVTPDGVESPTRFMLLDRDVLGGFLMLGAGYEASPQLRVGLSVGAGFLTIHNRSIASVQGGTFADQEVLIDLEAADWFIPRATASVVITPFSALELGLVLTAQGSVEASGDLELTANGFVGVPQRDCRNRTDGAPGAHCVIEDASLSVPFPPFEATLALRYADRRHPRERTLDPMTDERWDVELDLYWSQTSHIENFSLQLYDEMPGTSGAPLLAFSTAPEAVPLSLPATAEIPRHYRDTFGLRAGGEVALLPGMLSGRAGVSYETRAVPPQYMNIDLWPVAKLGLHLGGSLRLGSVTLAIAYSHVFYQPVDVDVGRGRVVEIVSQNPLAAQAVNEGSYAAALDVISGQANIAF